MNRKVVYPGTFDPVTNGHIDIINRASRLFDKVYVAVARTPDKNLMFGIKERVAMVRAALKGVKNVIVEPFEGLIVDYVRMKKSRVVIRGLRMISDFEYEFQMALTNRRIASDIETIFLMPSEKYSYLSSKLIKEVAQLGAPISDFVPKHVEKELRRKCAGKQNRIAKG